MLIVEQYARQLIFVSKVVKEALVSENKQETTRNANMKLPIAVRRNKRQGIKS